MKRALLVVVAVLAAVAFTPTKPAGATNDELSYGDTGPAVSALQRLLNSRDVTVCGGYASTARCRADFRVAVDGRFGEDTRHAVQMFQAQQGLLRDGKVGPRTRAELANPSSAPLIAAIFLKAHGFSESEAARAVAICKRESGCRIGIVVDRPSTRDLSYGAFGINYYGRLKQWRTDTTGPAYLHNVSWPSAVAAFERALRTGGGWCQWKKPYCHG